jgi:hypothetical protein
VADNGNVKLRRKAGERKKAEMQIEQKPVNERHWDFSEGSRTIRIYGGNSAGYDMNDCRSSAGLHWMRWAVERRHC